MSGSTKIRKFNIVNATKAHSATLFFFHGSGGCGDSLKKWVDIMLREELKFPHIKIVYPTAPAQPYTPNYGMSTNVWFNRKSISIEVAEEVQSINSMCENVMELIDAEVFKGIPYENIAVAGFSMGGVLSMHLAYRYKRSLAGCTAMSSFLNKNSVVYESLRANSGRTPPFLQYHGTEDELVPLKWGEETYANLKELGVSGRFIELNGADHELVESEVKSFRDWILGILPEK
ncbi:lysophospholipase-like protein 1 [Nomia melanderi]|uniref:lysophospholipase-like protein 1 n=1 Tax=Nomia melanderi TaxID=2448451 RepID=UPI003FCC3747